MAQLSVAVTLKSCIANSELMYPLPHPISSTSDDCGERRDRASLNIISTLRELSGQYWSMNLRLPLNPSRSRSIARFVSFPGTCDLSRAYSTRILPKEVGSGPSFND